jgi:hypothetical protein
MADFDAQTRRRRFLAAAAVAVTLVVAAPTPASAEEPSPTPFTADAEAAPMEMARPDAPDRRPETQAASGNLLYRNGRFRSLPDRPGAQLTVHRGLNDRGQTVGLYIDDGAEPGPDGFYPPEAGHGFVYDVDDGRFRTIDVPGVLAIPYDINDRGQIVGVSLDTDAVPGPDGLLPPGAQHAYLWERGRLTVVDPPDTVYAPNAYSINDRGDIVGVRIGAAGVQIGFLRRAGGSYVDLDPPGASENKALGINDRGEVVGAYLDDGAEFGPDGLVDPGTVHGYRWNSGRYARLDVPGARATVAADIDGRGRIVGDFKDADGRIRGFVRSADRDRSDRGHDNRWDDRRWDDDRRDDGRFAGNRWDDDRWDDSRWGRRDLYSRLDGPGQRSDTLVSHSNERGEAVIPAPGTIDAIENIVR